MNTSKILIAGTLTFNIALSIALVRAYPPLSQLFSEVSSQALLEKQDTFPGVTQSNLGLTRSPETQEYILDTVRANPDAVYDALKILQLSQSVALSSSLHPETDDVLENDPIISPLDIESTVNAHVGGNPNGDVTIVEFFDYNCSYCKSATSVVQDVVKNDGNIRIIYREFPILTPGSAYAARASLASRNQGLYEKFHKALMAEKMPIDEKKTLLIAVEVGLNIERLKGDMEEINIVEHLRTSQDLAAQYNIEGTPTFSINGEINSGAPSTKALIAAISKARSK